MDTLYLLRDARHIRCGMRGADFIKRLPIPAICLGGIAYGVAGTLPFGFGDKFAGAIVEFFESWLVDAARPTVVVFFSAMLLAWLAYQIAQQRTVRRHLNARLKLTELRDLGVKIRISARQLSGVDAVPGWIDDVKLWNQSVIAAIRDIDAADAGQFATLDFPGTPRAHLQNYWSNEHAQFYVMHDRRLVRLDDYMTALSRAAKGAA